MENPPIMLGEAPSKSGDQWHMFPLSGAVAETLCKLADIPPLAGESRYGQWTWALYDHFECENLIERYPGAQGKGAAFPLDVARPLAGEFAREHKHRVVVLLGGRLKSLFMTEIGEPDGGSFCRWSHRMVVWANSNDNVLLVPCQVVAIPHPSGLNRMLNDPAERERAGAVLREAMQRAAATTTV